MITRLKQNLNTDGFCFTKKLFSTPQVNTARRALWDVINGEYETGVVPESRFWNPGDDSKNIIKIDKPHLCNDTIFNLITDNDFGEYLADITEAEMIQVWHSQAVWKPAGSGQKGNAGWHRDIQYWPFWKPEGVFTSWIALTDVTEGSGPVRYIAGSNKWLPLEGLDFFDKDISKQENILDSVYNDYKVINANIKKGQTIIHSSQVYHSSVANVSRTPRVGMVIHFCTDRAQRVKISGENSSYLDKTQNSSICPIIYKS